MIGSWVVILLFTSDELVLHVHNWDINDMVVSFHRFTKDGVLAEGIFWDDVENLLDDYESEPRKSKWRCFHKTNHLLASCVMHCGTLYTPLALTSYSWFVLL